MRFVLRFIDWLTPRRQDVIPALSGAAIGFVILFSVRWAIALDVANNAHVIDFWRMEYGEMEAWALVAFFGSWFLRPFTGWLHRAARFVFHAFCGLLLIASGLEMGYFQATGSRIDFDNLNYFFESPAEVLPVVMAEVRPWHFLALAAGFAVALIPAFFKLRKGGSPWWGRLSLLFLLPSWLVRIDGHRTSPEKACRQMQPSLIETLEDNYLDHMEDYELPPAPGDDDLRVSKPTANPLPNIVLVMLESFSAKNTTLFDPTLPTTPNLVNLARQGLLVKDTFTVVPHSSKAFVAVLCGQYPELTKEVREARVGGLPGKCLTEILGEMGYRSAFIQTARESFEERAGLVHNLKFDTFEALNHLKREPFQTVNYFGIEDDAMLDPGMAWTAAGSQPFFAMYLTLATHDTYKTPSTFTKLEFLKFPRRSYRRYLNAVRYVDAFVGKLVAEYRQRGYGDNTLFIFLGDHGEAFGEHGRYFHDLSIYEEGLKVPFVLYGPGVLGDRHGVIDGRFQNIDVLPTVLDLLGSKIEAGSLPGRSIFQDSPKSRTIYHSCWSSFRCLASRKDDQKFIDHFRERPSQLFDLAKDPEERHDLASSTDPKVLQARRTDLRNWRAAVNGRYAARRESFLAGLQGPDDAPAKATWGDALDLVRCTTEKEAVEPADSIWVHCRWRLSSPLLQAWKVRYKLAGAFKTVYRASAPVEGMLPTFRWTPGVAVDDTYHISVPPDANPGDAVLKVGWKSFTGQRQTVQVPDGATESVDDEDFVPVAHITVLPRSPLEPPPLPGSEPTIVQDDVSGTDIPAAVVQ
jgi:lipoteichoic acid synthase